jgi:hypothetical protein
MFSLLNTDSRIDRMESEINDKITSIEKKLKEGVDSDPEIVIDEDFPESFVKQIEPLSVGDVKWKRFFERPEDGVYAVHGSMDPGSSVLTHCTLNADTYIYIIEGRIVNWTENTYGGDILVAADEVEEIQQLVHNTEVENWYKIAESTTHALQSVSESHFVLKFKVDAEL